MKVAGVKPMEIGEKSLTSVYQNTIVSHFQFAERFYVNTIFNFIVNSFMTAHGVD